MAFKLAGLCLALLPLIIARSVSSRLHELQTTLQSKQSCHHDDDYPRYWACSLPVPIDHFHNESKYEPHSNGVFNLHYWVDTSNYQRGGPVIVLEEGESPASSLELNLTLLHQLADATNGIAVVLEHRYYGQSIPNWGDSSTENLRFLTVQQSLADAAYFAQHAVFPGLEDLNLTAPSTAYIAYGASYAGALAAFLRKQYPNIYFGSISSSGVVKAIIGFWAYWEPARQYGPPDCISATQKLTNIVDKILLERNDTDLSHRLKALFGLEDMVDNADFASVLASGVFTWQFSNSNPNTPDSFSTYCETLTGKPTLGTYVDDDDSSNNLTATVEELIKAAGYGKESETLTPQMLNLITYIDMSYIRVKRQFDYQEEGFSSDRIWDYQRCTELGFFQPSGAPVGQLPLLSRTITLDYKMRVCRDDFNITTMPDTDVVNAYGGFDIAYDRLAFIDSADDPWRYATTHAPEAKNRTGTTNQPYLLVQRGGHGPDFLGWSVDEPVSVAVAVSEEIGFVKAWMEEWKAAH